MIRGVAEAWFMLRRQTRNFLREPVWVVLTLVQPFFWLMLYGQLFQRVVELPGFASGSYIQFLTPGIVVMTAYVTATYSGMGMLDDHERGVLQRFLATPVRRSALIVSQVLRAALTAILQTVIIVAVGYALGARVHSGVEGCIAICALAALLASGFAGLSHALALITRRYTTMVAVANFIGLPLIFLSATLISESVMPHWMVTLAKFNPVHWGVLGARAAFSLDAAGSEVALQLGLLGGFALVTTALATWAFRAYRRSM